MRCMLACSTRQWRVAVKGKLSHMMTPLYTVWRQIHQGEANRTYNDSTERNSAHENSVNNSKSSDNFSTLSSSSSSSFFDNAEESHSYIPSLRSALPPNAAELPESTFLKCIEKEIMDEKLRLDREDAPPSIPKGWKVHHIEGTSLIYGRRLWFPPVPTPEDLTGWENNAETPPNSERSESTAPENKMEHEEFAKEAVCLPINKQKANNKYKSSDANKFPFTLPEPTKRCVEKHFIRIQLTSRDASLDPEYDIRGEHFPFSFFVQSIPFDKLQSHEVEALEAASQSHDPAVLQHAFFGVEDSGISLFDNCVEAKCDVVEGELVVNKLIFHGAHLRRKPGHEIDNSNSNSSAYDVDPQVIAEMEHTAAHNNPFGGFEGPNLDEAEEEVLDGIQSWLAERSIDDQLGEFVGQYSVWVEQQEYERWLHHLRDYVAA